MKTKQIAAAPTPLLHTMTPGEWLTMLEADLVALMNAEAEARALSLVEQERDADIEAALCTTRLGHAWVNIIDTFECQTCGVMM